MNLERLLNAAYANGFEDGVKSNKSVLDAYDPINAAFDAPWTYRDSLERELFKLRDALAGIEAVFCRLDKDPQLVFEETNGSRTE